jgi:hypothetical protein
VQANRDAAPDEIVQAFKAIPEVLVDMGINALTVDEVEADDCIATLAAYYSKNGCHVTIYSGDKVHFHGQTGSLLYLTHACKQRCRFKEYLSLSWLQVIMSVGMHGVHHMVQTMSLVPRLAPC